MQIDKIDLDKMTVRYDGKYWDLLVLDLENKTVKIQNAFITDTVPINHKVEVCTFHRGF